MALTFGDNISYQGKKPLDSRSIFKTIADMKAYSENYLPPLAMCQNEEDGKIYTYDVNNEVNETLGKWRVLEGQGSGTSAVPIEKIKVNGELQTPVNKVVDITVPDAYDDTALSNRVKTIEDDYAKSSDIPSLSGYATETWVNEQGFLTEHQDLSAYATKDEIPTIPSKVSELTNDSNYQTAEQVNSTVTTEIAKVVADAPEDLNTLKEMSDWIAGHEDDASAMNSAISDNNTAIASLQSGKADKSDIPTTVAELTDSADYAKTADVNDSISALQTDKANASDLTAHTDDTDIHVTADDKTLWNTVEDKVNKTDIATTINSTSTDTQIPSTKATWDALTKGIIDAPILATVDEVNSFDRAYQCFMIHSTISEKVGLPISPFKSSWFCIHLSHSHGNRYPSQIAFEYAGAKRIMYRVSVNGVWISWMNVCTTSVEDVGWTAVTTTNTNISIDDGYIKYKVKNGICYVSVGGIRSSATGGQIISRSLPKADDTITYGSHLTSPGTGDNTGYMGTGSGGALIMNIKNTNVDLYGSFSYPVAES